MSNIEELKSLETEIAWRNNEIMRLQDEIRSLEEERLNIEDPPLKNLFPKKFHRTFNHAGLKRLSELYRLISGDYSMINGIDMDYYKGKKKYQTPKSRLMIIDNIGEKKAEMILAILQELEESKVTAE